MAELEPKVVQLVSARRTRVQQKHTGLDSLASELGIRLVKKADSASVVPTVPRIKATIAPVLPPVSRPAPRIVLEADKFNAILELLDNSGRQFERTPQSFRELGEEGLRDIILSNLNAVFQGGAGGETFRGIGKVDVHLQISQGEVFVAELKFWHGPQTMDEVVEQLRSRLTWRDSYGVALILSRNSGFSQALSTIRDTVPKVAGFVAGSQIVHAANYISARFTIPSDESRQANVHVLVYNLFVPTPGRRQVRRRKSAGTGCDS